MKLLPGGFRESGAEVLDDGLRAVGGAGDGVELHFGGIAHLLAHDGLQEAALDDALEVAGRFGVRKRLGSASTLATTPLTTLMTRGVGPS